MAISEQRYAAESIDSEGNVYKFDDIGCMARFAREHNKQEAASFVMDYDATAWVPARQAHYVRAPEIRTPMASGVIAFRGRATAERYAAKYGVKAAGLDQITEAMWNAQR